MIQILPNLAAQQTPVEGPGGASPQPGHPGPAFDKMLARLQDGSKQTEIEPAASESRLETGASQAALMELVGAIQVAMTTPVQSDLPLIIDGTSQTLNDSAVAVVGASPSRSGGLQLVPATAAVLVGELQTDMVSLVPHGDRIPTRTEAIGKNSTESGIDARRGVAEVTWMATDREARRILAAEPGVVDVPGGLPVNAPLEPSPKPVGAGLQPQGESAIHDEQMEAQTIETSSPLPGFRRTAVETTTVQWQFDPQSRAGFAEARPSSLEGHQRHADAHREAVEGDPVLVEGRLAIAEGRSGRVKGAGVPDAAAASIALRLAGKGGRAAAGSYAPDQQASNMQTLPIGQRLNVQYAEAAARPEPVEALQSRIIDQVVRGISLHRAGEHSDIVVRLNPPELGALRLQVSQVATEDATAGMTAHIQTTNSQVRGLLETHMPLLMDSLARAGLRMDSISVSVGSSFSPFAGGTPQHGQPNASEANPGTAGRQHAPTEAVAAPESVWMPSGHTGYSWLA